MSLPTRSRTTPLLAVLGHPLRGVLDTNVVIHWPLLDLADLPREVAITAVTLAELAAGVHAARTDRDRAQRLDLLQRVESAFDPLPFDAAAARAYGRIASAVRSAGRSPRARVADQMIAAIAASRGLALYTTNAGDLVKLDDMVTVVPVARPL